MSLSLFSGGVGWPPAVEWTAPCPVSHCLEHLGFINALAVAILSGILWQGNPPEECCDAEFDSKSRLRGMASMSDLLDDSLRHV